MFVKLWHVGRLLCTGNSQNTLEKYCTFFPYFSKGWLCLCPFLLLRLVRFLFFILMRPVVSTDTKQHLKFLRLCAHYSNALTF